MIDFNAFLDKIQKLTPQNVEMLAGEMARDPNAVPPKIGEMGMAGALQEMQNMMTNPQVAQAPTVSIPMTNQGVVGQGPMDPSQGLASLIAGPKGGQGMNLGGPDAGKMGDAGAAMQALQQRTQTRQRQNSPYISNLGFGAATPAKGLNLQAPQMQAPPALGQLLMGQRGR